MFHKAHSPGGILILAVAVVLGTAEPGQAGRGGGGGGYRGGPSGGYRGGYYGPYRGYYGYGGFYGYGYGYGGYLGYDPYYPYAPYLPYYPTGPAPSIVVPPSGYPAPAPETAETIVPAESIAHVLVKVPANAELWFNGTKMKTTGGARSFETPPLTSDGRVDYEVRARWTENGKAVSQSQKFSVGPGDRINVSFPTASPAE